MSLEQRIRNAVTKLITAEVADSWKGSQHPDDYEEIENELKQARKRFEKLMIELRAFEEGKRLLKHQRP